ncbi:hypothetical protein [Williamsia serinedens]|uniref:Minor tail protein n=1 Tax=Williamsia serinedens TaxID=391736 RepID=A0ABT1H5Y5_9NOCA|nr:hypothetical protein [Williamsia serinedens]MCP2162645.1 hypothetical protein [Williamsia serinedens]
MALVTVTGTVTDITGRGDPDQLVFSSPSIRQDVMSPRYQRVSPDATTGQFSVQLVAGPATVRVGGKVYPFIAAAGDLWSMIQVGINIPPGTSAEKLQAAVAQWAQDFADARYATPASVTTAVNALKNLIVGPNAPATLDTIAEIAAALGNDPQMVANLTTTVAGKYSKPSSGIPLSDLKKADLDGAYAPRWQPNTAYTAGTVVLAPTGDVVTAKADFTSGASYVASNWNPVNAPATEPQARIDGDAATLTTATGRAVAFSLIGLGA